MDSPLGKSWIVKAGTNLYVTVSLQTVYSDKI